jgi:predicted Zn finger-like uncharacterized protein
MKPIVGEPVKIFASIPCPNCNTFFEIPAEKCIGQDHIVVECPRCDFVRIVTDVDNLPQRVVREG